LSSGRTSRTGSPTVAFKYWPLVRDVRWAMKCGRYLHGARKRQPELNWGEFRRIARRFKADDMGSYAERGYLFQLASALPEDAQVVEVGSWMGASTCFLAGGLRGAGARIHAVDNFQGLSTCGEDAAWYDRHFRRLGRKGTLEIFRENLAALGFTTRIEPFVGDSVAAVQAWAAKRGTIDLVFIDGDHSYEACQADIAGWSPFLKPGGIIAFHDFGSRAEGVTRAIFEAIKAGRFAQIEGVAGTIIAFRL